MVGLQRAQGSHSCWRARRPLPMTNANSAWRWFATCHWNYSWETGCKFRDCYHYLSRHPPATGSLYDFQIGQSIRFGCASTTFLMSIRSYWLVADCWTRPRRCFIGDSSWWWGRFPLSAWYCLSAARYPSWKTTAGSLTAADCFTGWPYYYSSWHLLICWHLTETANAAIAAIVAIIEVFLQWVGRFFCSCVPGGSTWPHDYSTISFQFLLRSRTAGLFFIGLDRTAVTCRRRRLGRQASGPRSDFGTSWWAGCSRLLAGYCRRKRCQRFSSPCSGPSSAGWAACLICTDPSNPYRPN